MGIQKEEKDSLYPQGAYILLGEITRKQIKLKSYTQDKQKIIKKGKVLELRGFGKGFLWKMGFYLKLKGNQWDQQEKMTFQAWGTLRENIQNREMKHRKPTWLEQVDTTNYW